MVCDLPGVLFWQVQETPANLGGGLIYCGPMADGLIRRKPFR